MRVDVTAAFLTGRPLRVRVRDYAGLQADLARGFEELGDAGWTVNDEQWRQKGTYFSGGGFASMLPIVVARRRGPVVLEQAQQKLRERPESERTWLAREVDGWDLDLQTVRIDVYDLGMSVMTATVATRLPAGLDLRSAARTLKRLVWLKPDSESGVVSPLSAVLREMAEETVSQFATVVARCIPGAVQEAWLAPFLHALAEDGETRHEDWGRLLWLHPVHILEVAAGDDAALRAAAVQLAPPFHRTIRIPDGIFVPGIGWSAIVTYAGAPGVEVPMKLIELHWAYIALYMEMDRGLLGVLDDDRWNRPESLHALERDADRVFGDYMRLMEARARLDSVLAGLGGDEYAIWEIIADVTKFEALVEGVDRKLDVLSRVAERRVQQAAASRARRTSAVLSFLTALTVVTVAVALLTNFIGTRSDRLGHLQLRVVVVVAALTLATALYRETFRDRAYRLGAVGSTQQEQPRRQRRIRRRRARGARHRRD